jgi:hypothetical protein
MRVKVDIDIPLAGIDIQGPGMPLSHPPSRNIFYWNKKEESSYKKRGDLDRGNH